MLRKQKARYRAFLVALCALLCALLAASLVAAQNGEEPATVIFLSRHAEALYPPPDDAPRNPPLNVMGQDRANALVRLLEPAGIEHIHSTDYHRTQETAAPLARRLGLDVGSYDPSDLAAVAKKLLRTPGRHLVLGHSNTTPELVGHLGGEPGPPIDERTEYDRLYMLVIPANGPVTTTVLRYGAPLALDWQERAGERRAPEH